MKLWKMTLVAVAALAILLPHGGSAQSPAFILAGEQPGALSVVPGDDGSLGIGPLSLSRDGEVHPVFDSILIGSFGYKSSASGLSSTAFSGESASMVQYDYSSPVIEIRTAEPNCVRFDLASSAGALASHRWVMVGDADARADLFIRGEGIFAKTDDTVDATLESGDALYLRVRSVGEPEEVSRGIATGMVSAEMSLENSGGTAFPEHVSYDGSVIAAVSLNENAARFTVEGSAPAVYAFRVTLPGDSVVKVNGEAVPTTSSLEELTGDRARALLRESGDEVFALVYVPSSSASVVEIGVFMAGEPVFTVLSFIAAGAGVALVATATIYLFRK